MQLNSVLLGYPNDPMKYYRVPSNNTLQVPWIAD